MANMGYCRFRNTLGDLADCVEHWDCLEEDDEEEKRARDRIAKLAHEIVDLVG